MKLLRYVFVWACLSNVLLTGTVTKPEKFKLAEKTAKKYKEFQELIKDAKPRATFAKIIIAAAPFRHLLSGRAAPAAIEIAREDWEIHLSAMCGIDAAYRHELLNFAGLEAISSLNIGSEQLFWQRIYEQLVTEFNPPKKASATPDPETKVAKVTASDKLEEKLNQALTAALKEPR